MERENEPMSAPRGTSEVHSDMSVQPSKGEGMSGRFEGEGSRTMERTRGRVEQAREGVAERAEAIRGRIDEARTEVRDRATEIKDRARERVSDARAGAQRVTGDLQDRANRALDGSGARDTLDRYPLAALGLAFGAGYLLAGSGGEKRGVTGKARQQIRGMIVGAASAAIAQQARGMLGLESGQGGGLGHMIDSLSGRNRAGRPGGLSEEEELERPGYPA